jgi:hypothetical protein
MTPLYAVYALVLLAAIRAALGSRMAGPKLPRHER